MERVDNKIREKIREAGIIGKMYSNYGIKLRDLHANCSLKLIAGNSGFKERQ